MTWISLICLLALSSSAFGRVAYGGSYGSPSVPSILTSMRDSPIQRPFLPSLPVSSGYGQAPISELPSPVIQQDTIQPSFSGAYGSSFVSQPLTRTLPVQGYGGSISRIGQFDQQIQPVQPTPMLTPADLLCRGQQAETVIPFENGRKFVVCLDESKGVEQECPKGLYYHETSRRCERKLGPLENVCVSQPCLNGGQCIQADSTYQCQCAPGFDGRNCELDARICQTQQPCGAGSDVRCQSFRLGAALQYICILQDGLAYGLSVSQAVPSPCRGDDGVQALTVSTYGFIMCDGERMFVESCPGGTIWDDVNKACVWPDMQTTVPQADLRGYGSSSYGQSRTLFTRPTFNEQVPTSSYGSSMPISRPVLEQPRLIQSFGQVPFSSYGGHSTVSRPVLEQPKLIQSYGQSSSYDQPIISRPVLEQPKLINSYDSQVTIPKPVFDQTKYGSSYDQPMIPRPVLEQPKLISSYDSIPKPVFEQPKVFQSYGSSFPMTKPVFEQPKLVQDLTPVKSYSGY